jgi:CRP-like cAMP-binding protein
MKIMELPLFEDLNRDELALIEPYLICRDIKQGTVIYKQGEHGNSICFVVEGALDVIKKGDDNNEVQVASLRKGQAVGEMAIIDGFTRSATIRAQSDSSILILKRDDFNKCIDQNPAMGVKILKALARMLSSNLRATSEAVSKMMASL